MEYEHLYLYQDVDDDVVYRLVDSIMRTKKRKILLHVNSFGGDSDSCSRLIHVMQSNRIPIDTIIDGYAASAAAMIFLAGRNRYVHPTSWVMWHFGESGIGRNSQTLTCSELYNAELRLQHLDENLIAYVASNVNLDEKTVRKMLSSEAVCSSKWMVVMELAKLYPITSAQSLNVDSSLITSLSMYDTTEALVKTIHTSEKPVVLFITKVTYIQTLFEVFVVLNAIRSSNQHVSAVCDGLLTDPVAAIVYLNCHKRIFPKKGVMKTSMYQLYNCTKVDKKEFSDSLQDAVIKAIRDCTKISGSLLDKWIKQSLYFTASQALQYGLCDELA